MSMATLIVAAFFFVGIHPLISGGSLRARLVAALGEPRYRGLFSLFSLVGLVALVLAYRAAPFVPVWTPPVGFRHLSTLLMLPAFFFVVVGTMTKGPTGAGREKLLRESEAARGILRVTRHPFLVGTAIWAATHLLVRGDAASMTFFAAFLFLGVTGPVRIDRRQRAAFGEDRRRFDDATSVIPFAAIVGGRNRFVFGEIGFVRCGVALAVYVFFLLVGHRLFFGVAPLG
jgi:uncharacterized membrane protein